MTCSHLTDASLRSDKCAESAAAQAGMPRITLQALKMPVMLAPTASSNAAQLSLVTTAARVAPPPRSSTTSVLTALHQRLAGQVVHLGMSASAAKRPVNRPHVPVRYNLAYSTSPYERDICDGI